MADFDLFCPISGGVRIDKPLINKTTEIVNLSIPPPNASHKNKSMGGAQLIFAIGRTSLHSLFRGLSINSISSRWGLLPSYSNW